MLAFSAVILALVYLYRVEYNPHGLNDFKDHHSAYDDHAIYVDFSAPRLVFIASWSSTLAPLLVSSALFLASFPTAKSILATEQARKETSLPTPFQVSLILRMLLAGGVMTLWEWLYYLIGWKKKRQAQGHTLKAVAAVLITATFLRYIVLSRGACQTLLTPVYSLLVFLADTWLHVTTSSTQFTQISPLPDPPQYSFGLTHNCTTGPSYYCYLRPAATNVFLIDSQASFAVLGNISSTMTVITLGDFTYLGVPDSPSLISTDYRAYTYALRTQCAPITGKCSMFSLDGANTPFYCTKDFQGDVTSIQPWQMTYVADSTFEQNVTYSNNITNPFYFGWAALINSAGDAGPLDYSENPEIVHPIHGGTAFVLGCNTTVYDVSYDSVDGKIARFVVQMSNASLANFVQKPISATSVADPYLQQNAVTASFSNSVQELADKMALSYSKAALSIAAQSFKQAPTEYAQQRTSLLVARVSVAPLFALVGANLLFVVAGIVLLVIALIFRTTEVREAQARLSITGVVAHAFENRHSSQLVKEVEELFEENEGRSSVRVGIERARAGGYVYRVFGDGELVRLQTVT
jgi:uncharacterized membrane protein